MSDFKDAAIQATVKERLAKEIDEYKQAALHFLIYQGAAVNPGNMFYRSGNINIPDPISEIDYYSCNINHDAEETAKAEADFLVSGIDYLRSLDPAEHIGTGFVDTSTKLEVKYLRSTIYSNNGNGYIYGMLWDKGFGELIIQLGQVKNLSLEEICSRPYNSKVRF